MKDCPLEILTYGKGPIILLFHGAASHAIQWKKLIQLMQAEYQLIAFNQYGYGASPAWSAPTMMTLQDQIKPVLHYIKDLKQPVHLVGHSHGATLAALTATHIHQHVLSLSLYEPNTFCALDLNDPVDRKYYQDTQQAFEDFEAFNQTSEQEYQLKAQQLFDFWLGQGAWAGIQPRLQSQIISYMSPTLNEVYTVMHDPFPLHDLAVLASRTLIMYDPHTAPPAQQVIKRYISVMPTCQTHTFPHLGHLAPIRYAEQINPVIQKHIRRHS